MKFQKTINPRLIALVLLIIFSAFSEETKSENIRPTSLKRIPLILIAGEQFWELTSSMIRTEYQGFQLMDQPYGLDVKAITATNYSVTVITDASWCNIMFLKTEVDENNQQRASQMRGYGKWGKGQNRFKFPVGVEIGGYDDRFDPQLDYIYIADAGNARIVALSYNQWTNTPSWAFDFGTEHLTNPRGLVYYDNGTENRNDDLIFVTDIDQSQIVCFTAAGQYVASFGTRGYGYGQLFTPMAICKGPAGSNWDHSFYVVDKYNFKVCRFTWATNSLVFSSEKLFDEMPRSELCGITTDYSGFVYVADRAKDRILKLGPNLSLVAVINETTGGTDFRFNQPRIVRFYDGALTVVNEYCETSGFMCFGVPYLDSLRFDEDWRGLDFNLTSDILVPCGRTLKFGPGAHIAITPLFDENNMGIDPDRIEIIVEGTLISAGTTPDSVLIYSSGTPPVRGDWYGIRVKEPCGLIDMQYTSVRNAENAIDLYDGTNNQNYIFGTMKFSQFENNATAGIYSANSIISIKQCLIRDNTNYGLYSFKTSADVDGSRFWNNSGYGIWVNLSGANGDSVRIVKNTIGGDQLGTQSFNGLYLAHNKARVEGCNIGGYNSSAILVSGNSPKLMLDTLTCGVGIDCQNNTSPLVRYCRITPTTMKIGVNAANGSLPNLGTGVLDKGNNSIFPSTQSGYRVVNKGLTSISAKYNWWGTINPLPSMFSGPVSYSPWLNGAPPPPPKTTPESELLPSQFYVSEIYPNPFNPTAKINYSIPSPGMINITVYNIMGQTVKNLDDKYANAGFYQVMWDGTNNNGMSVGSGVYLINVRYGESQITKKAILLR